MAKDQKVYMPLMIGDWLKGTRGMKAEVRGVYVNLLLYQWDNGYIPSDWEELCLIDPELPKVWDKLKSKFVELEPGKLQNKKNEEVREFWQKQRKNGSKGGRPKKENPKENPDNNPNTNPNHNHHNDLDLDYDNEVENKIGGVGERESTEGETNVEGDLQSAFDEIYLEQLAMNFRGIDVNDQLKKFKLKVRGSPDEYRHHGVSGLRLAFNYQLRNCKPEKHDTKRSTKNRDRFPTTF